MPFPNEPLPVSVDIAPGASPAGTPDSWEPYWVDITNDARVKSGITIEEGIPDEANQADPGSCDLTIANGPSKVVSTLGQIGCYSPRNVAGPYWGKLTKNTPLRIRLQRGRDTFARTTSSGWGVSESGITWSNTGMTYLSTDGTRGLISGLATTGTTTATSAGAWDFEMTGGFAIDILPGGSGINSIFIVNFRRSANANQYRFRLDYEGTSGLMALYISRVIDNVSTTLVGIYAPGIGTTAANTRYNYRLKVEGGSIWVKVWIASGSEPSTWSATVTGEGGYTLDNTSLGTNIQMQRSQVGSPLTTAMYFYDISIRSYPFIGTVPQWPIRWDKSGNDSTAPIKATGVLRRLQAGKSPLKSPLYAFMDALKPVAIWTLEDESGATLAASQTVGVRGATLYSTSPAGWNGVKLAGTSAQYAVGTDTTIAGTLPKVAANGAWLAWFAFYMPVLPVTNPTIFRVRSSGTVAQWDMKISDSFGGVMYLVGQAPDGTVLVNQSITYVPGQWVIGQIEIQQSGANVTGRIVRYAIGDGTVDGATSSAFAGNIGAPNGWSIYGSVGFQASAAGPVAFYPFIPSVNIPNLQSGARGFAGETASARIARLAAQAGVRLDLISGGQVSAMGPQASDTLNNNLAESSTTDMGFLTEFRGGLRYRTRGRRYGQNPRMTLDMALGHLSEPPEPTDDDKGLRNDITVSRRDGSSARAYDETSIAANGLYDTSIDINPSSDSVLPGQAGFRLMVGTWDELRWPSITINVGKFTTTAGFVERITSLDPGTFIQIINPPANLPVGTIYLLVEHIRHTMTPYEWIVELTCTPYGPWRIWANGTPNGILFNRMDLVGSTLGSVEAALAVGATDTWTITNSGRNWNAAAVPFDWNVGGEVVTVTALSGSGTQTATVTRGVGGITKAHVIGEPVHLNTIMYVAH